MIIGCVKEIKKYEFRVGVTPSAANEYVRNGHKVLIETGAGLGSGFKDEAYSKQFNLRVIFKYFKEYLKSHYF